MGNKAVKRCGDCGATTKHEDRLQCKSCGSTKWNPVSSAQACQSLGNKAAKRKDNNLIEAAKKGELTDVKALLKAGADIEASDDYKKTPLIHAAEEGDLPLVQALLKAGADTEAADGEKRTPLIWAAIEGRLPLVQALLKAGADTEAADEKGKMPLDHALAMGAKRHFEIAKILVANGVGLDTVYKDGRTPRQLFAACQNKERSLWGTTFGCFLGRYKMIDLETPVHRSKTCIVNLAIDMLDNGGGRVAVKRMRNLDEAMRELDARKESQLKDCVISVVRFHGPASETQGVALPPQECTAAGAEYPYVLVMERGDRSLHHSLSSERIAGFAYEAIRDIIRRMVKLAITLHSKGLAHNDLKPRNVLWKMRDGALSASGQVIRDLLLCDMDAATKLGKLKLKGLKISEGYMAPEMATYLQALASSACDSRVEEPAQTTTTVAYDVWSIGAIIYELCTGQTLFPQDISDDNLAEYDRDILRLCTWRCIPDDMLDGVFRKAGADVSPEVRGNARDLIRWILQGDPKDRPTMEQILAHPFLAISGDGDDAVDTDDVAAPATAATKEEESSPPKFGVVMSRPMRRHDEAAASKDISGDAGGNVAPSKDLKSTLTVCNVPLSGGAAALRGIKRRADDDAVVSVEVKDPTLQKRIGKLLRVKDHSSWRMRYHAFVSHAQLEASGDVGTVFHLGESLGLHGWRDMNQPDLTAQGMMQGVYDSDVFILFLTCSVLSRKYCQMEIGWAMAFDKPIVIIYEEEERFFSFDLHRWQNDLCVKAPLPSPDKDGTYAATVTDKEKKQGFRWAHGLPQGGLPHAECPTAIHDWITAAMKASAPSPSASSLGGSRSSVVAGASSVRPPVAILPFRRRDFEVSALMRELVRCVGRTKDVPWGSALPPTLAERAVRSSPAKLGPPRVHLIWDGSSKRATAMKESLSGSLEGLNKRYGYSADRHITCTGDVSPAAGLDDVKRATHILVILTDTHQPEGATPWLASTTAASEQLAFALEHLPNPSRKVTYVYDKPKGLNSTVFALSPSIEDKIKYSIWGHEALVFRDQDNAQKVYEHESMIMHIVGLMITANG